MNAARERLEAVLRQATSEHCIVDWSTSECACGRPDERDVAHGSFDYEGHAPHEIASALLAHRDDLVEVLVETGALEEAGWTWAQGESPIPFYRRALREDTDQ